MTTNEKGFVAWKLENGKWTILDRRNQEFRDRYETEAEAQAQAEVLTRQQAERIAKNKADGARRKAEREAAGPLADQYFIDPEAY